MLKITSQGYNNKAIARLESDNTIHNHIYHDCKVGYTESNFVYNNNGKIVGRVDNDGFIFSTDNYLTPVGWVNDKGYIYVEGRYKENVLIGRVDFSDDISYKVAAASYLLLIHENR